MLEITEKEFEHINSKELRTFITAVGYENRASYLAKMLNNDFIDQKYCIQLVDEPNQTEMEYFLENNYIIIPNSQFDSIKKKIKTPVLIDYSVMMKSIYSGLVEQLANSIYQDQEYLFSYSKAKFEFNEKKDFNFKSLSQILLTEDKIDIRNTATTTLVISLGYERLTAVGLIENLEINYENVIVLINKTADNDKYYNECKSCNSKLLSILKDDQIIEFDFFNFQMTLSILDSILFRLYREGKKVIISPMSVKSFSLISMVLSLKYPNTIFYNASSHSIRTKYIKEPETESKPIIYGIQNIKATL